MSEGTWIGNKREDIQFVKVVYMGDRLVAHFKCLPPYMMTGKGEAVTEKNFDMWGLEQRRSNAPKYNLPFDETLKGIEAIKQAESDWA